MRSIKQEFLYLHAWPTLAHHHNNNNITPSLIWRRFNYKRASRLYEMMVSSVIMMSTKRGGIFFRVGRKRLYIYCGGKWWLVRVDPSITHGAAAWIISMISCHHLFANRCAADLIMRSACIIHQIAYTGRPFLMTLIFGSLGRDIQKGNPFFLEYTVAHFLSFFVCVIDHRRGDMAAVETLECFSGRMRNGVSWWDRKTVNLSQNQK